MRERSECEMVDPGFKSRSRRLHRAIDVFLIAFCDIRKHVPGGGIVGGKSFAAYGIHPPAVDQHFVLLAHVSAHSWIHLDDRSCCCHFAILLQAVNDLREICVATPRRQWSASHCLRFALLRFESRKNICRYADRGGFSQQPSLKSNQEQGMYLHVILSPTTQ
jgi:hypothetical protein